MDKLDSEFHGFAATYLFQEIQFQRDDDKDARALKVRMMEEHLNGDVIQVMK